jgi:branched-chain amino acid transport system substrate-binding protein
VSAQQGVGVAICLDPGQCGFDLRRYDGRVLTLFSPAMPNHVPAFLAASLFLFAHAAGAVDGITPKQILIGQTITLQDGKNDYGTAVLAGVQTYLAAANRQGGVHGRTIVLKTLDDDNRADRAEANARQLLMQDKAFLLFGSIEGGPSTAVMKVAVESHVPFFGPMAGSPTLRRPHQPLVFPVRAEHLEEFRALLDYARKTGSTRVAFVRSDSETGLQHLANVKRLCAESGMELVLDLPFKSETTDVQIDDMVARIGASNAQVVLNHGSPAMYERLVRKAQALRVRATFNAVNSGSAQLARRLGEQARGMVFSQVVPSPWERKSQVTREYQDEYIRQRPGQEFSYGSLEGFLTAKALVTALRLAGPNPTREGFVRSLHAAGGLDLGGGLRARYTPGDHTGLTLVDLAIVTREGQFQH